MANAHITQQPARITWSYAHWHVTFEEEKPIMLDLVCKSGMKHWKTHVPTIFMGAIIAPIIFVLYL